MMEEKKVLEEKKAKSVAKASYTIRLSADAKKEWLEEVGKRGWKNNEVADNLLMLLRRENSPQVEDEYEQQYKAFVTNNERSIKLFLGVIDLAKENVAREADAQKELLASRDQTIADLQAKSVQHGKDMDEKMLEMREVLLEKDQLLQEIARLQKIIADKDKIINAKDALLETNANMTAVLQSVKEMLGKDGTQKELGGQ